MKKTLVALAALLTFFAGNAFAVTYTYFDTWKDWPGYTSQVYGLDAYGTPKVDRIEVTVDGGILQRVKVFLTELDVANSFDALFVNAYDTITNARTWDDWDYLVYGNKSAESGLYSVQAGWNYTLTSATAGNVRQSNPNGIDALTLLNSSFAATGTHELIYDMTNLNINVANGFFVAYAPWCANDVIGGGMPVPEPNSMLLLGFGIAGLGLYRRIRK